MSLKVQKNSRQIPSLQQYTANEQYNDILYGYLQQISYLDLDKERYVNVSDINYSALASRLGISRQTVKKRFENLIKMGLINIVPKTDKQGEIIKDKKGEVKPACYKITNLTAQIATLVPYETLCVLVDTLSNNSISVFVYLLNRFFANKEKEFIVTMGQIKTFIGIASSTTSNNEIISNILMILKKLGLINYVMKTENDKTLIYIKNVVNKIESC